MLEKTLESPMDSMEIKPVNLKGNQPWILIGRTDVEALILWPSQLVVKETTNWKRPWCWERLKAEGGKGNRGWDGCVASAMQWTWTWASSRRWWGTARPGMLQSMELHMTEWLNSNNLDSSHLCWKLCSPNAQFYSTHLFLFPKWTSLHKALLSC